MDNNLKKVKNSSNKILSKLKSIKTLIILDTKDNSVRIKSTSNISEENYNIAIGIIDSNIIDNINTITPNREWKIFIKSGTSGTSGTSGV
jgi:hypothetical protein